MTEKKIIVFLTSIMFLLLKTNAQTVLKEVKSEQLDTTYVSVKYNDCVVRKEASKLGYVRIYKHAAQPYKAFVDSLESLTNVEKVVPITIGEYLVERSIDPRRTDQIYLDLLNMNNVWSRVPERQTHTIIAILDSGFDFAHPDFGVDISQNEFGRLYVNHNEIPENDLDDDNDGYVDNYLGWNFETGCGNINNISTHGTSVYGLFGAINNNGEGISSLLGGVPNITLMPLVVGDYFISSSYVADAIVYAVDHGANIINMSFSVACTDELEDAIAYAKNNNVLMIASAGNEGHGYRVSYPASNYDVMAVASVDNNGERSDFSNKGDLDIAAYGEDVLTTVRVMDPSRLNYNYTYDYHSGTSYSSPMIAAIAAIMRQANPLLNAQSLREIIDYTASKTGTDNYYNYNNYFDHRIDGAYQDFNVSWNSSLGFGLVDPSSAIEECFRRIPSIRILDISSDDEMHTKEICFTLDGIENCFCLQDYEEYGDVTNAQYLVDWSWEVSPLYHSSAEFDTGWDEWYYYISGDVRYFVIKGTIMDLAGNELLKLSTILPMNTTPFRVTTNNSYITISREIDTVSYDSGEIRVYNLQNQLVHKKTVGLADSTIIASTEDIPNGHYIVVLSSNGEKLASEHIIIKHK